MTEHVSRVEANRFGGGWWLLLIVGVLSVVAGVIILFKPSESLPTLAVIAGIFLLLDGILELADSLFGGTRNRGLVALFGVLTAIVGVLLIRHPGRECVCDRSADRNLADRSRSDPLRGRV